MFSSIFLIIFTINIQSNNGNNIPVLLNTFINNLRKDYENVYNVNDEWVQSNDIETKVNAFQRNLEINERWQNSDYSGKRAIRDTLGYQRNKSNQSSGTI